MKIAIVVGSIREGRVGSSVGSWVLESLGHRDDATFELVELADHHLPLFTSRTLPAAAKGHYDDPAAQAWGDTIARFDGYIFVTPEYNHGIPGAFKNAYDTLGVEWQHKAVAFVSYGANDGVRAVEQWRQVVANASMFAVRASVGLSLFSEFGHGGLRPSDRRTGELAAMADQLVAAARAMATLRAK
ncbi:MAG: NAD(P)H-dependent oxidoreductase [Propionibacterium sp.]|nr:NAD(P)H-dependent oxidoreductase [Propionibacterium sp.]